MRIPLSSVGPLIGRELRVESRRPLNYWLRTGALGLMLIGVIAVAIKEGGLDAGSGAALLTATHICLVVAIWLTVPVLAGDSISREVREGTLGLLLLTPLTPRGIVIGKGLLHLVRGSSLLLSAVPLLGICLLLGGVSAQQVAWSVIISASMLCLALAAGLLASAYNDRWLRALLWAFCLNAVFVLLYVCAFAVLFHLQVERISLGFVDVPELLMEGIEYIVLGWRDAWSYCLTMRGFYPVVVQAFAICVLLLGWAVAKSAARVSNLAAGPQRSAPVRQLYSALFRPVLFTRWLRRLNLKLLELNPVAWLQQRLPQARIGKWVICFGSLAGMTLGNRYQYKVFNEDLLFGLFTALSLMLAFVSASSFRNERESGAFELLLVTPLTERHILIGRLFGIYWLFLPTVLLSLSLIAYGIVSFGDDDAWLLLIILWVSLGSFFSVPLFGVNASMRLKHFLPAWLLTCAFAALVALCQVAILTAMLIVFQQAQFVFEAEDIPPIILLIVNFVMLLWTVYLTRFLWTRLHRGLTRRTFAAMAT